MRASLGHLGECHCCGRTAHLWVSVAKVLDYGTPAMPPAEPDMTLPPLCDDCDYAQRRWEAWQRHVACPGEGYPYDEPPPKSPPVRPVAEY